MFLWPKNQTYTKEPRVKTIIAPITLLLLCGLWAVIFSPFNSAEMASVFGIEKRVSMRVDTVQRINPDPMTNGWNCDHWVAYGRHENRELFTRSCHQHAAAPAEGDSVDIIVAPNSNEGYLLARGSANTLGNKIFTVLLTIALVYGVALSLRMLYIGYTSNWRQKS